MTPTEKRVIALAEKYAKDFPLGYDAHRDGLTDAYEHRQTVNELLAHLRSVLFIVSADERARKARKRK